MDTPSASGSNVMPNAGVQQHENFSDAVARIERLGKSLFGVTACAVHLDGEGSGLHTGSHQYCARLPLGDALHVMPEKSSPFSPALGKIDNFEVRFYAVHPLRKLHVAGILRIAGEFMVMNNQLNRFPPQFIIH